MRMLTDQELQHAKLLILRLERLSVDSISAHRASGLRGSLLRMVEENETGVNHENSKDLEELLTMGYLLMEKSIRV